MSQSATPSASRATGDLAATTLAANARVDGAVAVLIEELRQAQARLTGAQPAKAALAESYKGWLDRNAAVRGRASWY
ncbi:MAG: hypothetical protein ACO3SJ_04125, partial [Phycisphaerales bacterium]